MKAAQNQDGGALAVPIALAGARRFDFRKVLRRLERLLAVLGLCFLVYHLGFGVTVMTSDSMSPALQGTAWENGDRIMMEKVSRWFRKPRRWEIYFYCVQRERPEADPAFSHTSA